MNLKSIKSDNLLGIKHGFFTRLGGVSSNIYSGLNCGLGSNDKQKSVHQNRMLVAKFLDIRKSQLIFVHQIHSAKVITIRDKPTKPLKGDAIVTNSKNLALSILTADCQPVLFADKKNSVIGAAHAGWKGAFDGILQNTIKSMCKIGADIDQIYATIGPSISQKNYEVGPEFFERICKNKKDNERFFLRGRSDRFHFNLIEYSLHQIEKTGVQKVDFIDSCTYQNPNLHFSYRRSVHQSENDYGRMLSTIMLEA
jgi:YfiH family protein